METNGFHGHENSASSDLDESSFLETSSSTTTTAATITPIPSTRRYSAAGVVRSLFHAVLVQNTEHLDHVLTSLSLDPNNIRDREGKTMLMVAGTENKHRVLRYLLALPSIDVDMQDDEGESALYQAAAAGSTECVQLLLHAGASATLGNEESITPLIIASYNGFVSICRLLIAIGHADVNQQDSTLKSALLLASYAGHVDVMAELIEHGASLNTLDQYGWSSLMLAAYAGKLEACKLLLAHGADPHIRTANGKNARSLSWDAGHKSIASYISKFLARDINMSTSSSGTASGTGSGSGISSMTLIQQILPAVPKSPSRRTHSPAPSLPSVPEEAQEEDHYRPRRSFSAHNSTISRQSALSSRLTSAPKGRRPRSINVAPIQPKLSLDEPVSPLPSATNTTMPPAFLTERDPLSRPANVDAAVSPAAVRAVPERAWPVAHAVDAAVAHGSSHEEPQQTPRKVAAGLTPPTQKYTVHRSGIIPRYGTAQIDYQLEIHPHATSSILSPANTTSVADISLQGPPSKGRSEREKEHDMEKHLNRRIIRQRRFKERSRNYAWFAFSQCTTICCPSMMFPRSWSKDRRQDWREKVALCVMIILLSVALGFLAFGLALVTCRPRSVQSITPADFKQQYGNPTINADEQGGLCAIRGVVYDIKGVFFEGFHPSLSGNNVTWAALDTFLSANYGDDISSLFPPADLDPTCQLFGLANGFGHCSLDRGNFNHCHDTPAPEGVMQRFTRSDIRIAYDWEDVRNGALGRRLVVYDGTVLDVTNYLAQNMSNIASAEEKDKMAWINSLVGKDATIAIRRHPDYRILGHCLQGAFKVGVLSGQTNGCLASIVINTLALSVLLLITFMRLASALVYHWMFLRPITHPEKGSPATSIDVKTNGDNPVLMLVTCQATDQEQQIKATLDSLVLANRSGSSTLLLVVADEATERPPGSGTSQGAQSCVQLMDKSATVASVQDEKGTAGSADIEQDVESLAVCNLQQADTIPEGIPAIYSGFYQVEARRVPYVLVSLPASRRRSSQEEYGNWSKKRLVVRWLHRICFNEPVTAFEYSLFERTRTVLGHGPERFDMLLMAAVGSECEEHSIFQMITALRNNERIMGVSAYRRISNNLDTWLTRIQDYENSLTLHFKVAFESLIGAVDCLPSEFSLYRIKVTRADRERRHGINVTGCNPGDTSLSNHMDSATRHRSDGGEIKSGTQQDVDSGDSGVDSSSKEAYKQSHQRFIPIMIHPDVVSSFTAVKTRTLHERSMLTNGTEDRFLTGLLCRTFPSRRVVYLPHAICRSRATASFSKYLRQQTRATIGRFHASWEHLRSAQPRGTRSVLVYILVFVEWLSFVLSPVIVVLAWAMSVLVAVGAVTGAGALFSLPTVLALAFALSVMALQPLLGLLLGSRGPAVNHLGLFLYLATIPLRSAFIPVYAFLHFDKTEPWLASDACDDASEPRGEAPPVNRDTDTDQMLQTSASRGANGSRRLRYLAQWHSMHVSKTKRDQHVQKEV